jgi:hypothetical protein
MKFLTSRIALIASIAVIVLAGLVFYALDGTRHDLYRAITAAYLVSAVYYVIDLTPRVLRLLRPVVLIDNTAYQALSDRIAGTEINTLLKLFAPVVALLWASNALLRVIGGLDVSFQWNGVLTETPMPIIEVIFSAVAIWRTYWLARLSSNPLDINLFDAQAVYPFGQLSFAYAAVISIRMVLRIVFFGVVENGGMAAVFTLASVASLIALIVPIWSVHSQMAAAKIKILQRLDAEMNAVTQPLIKNTNAVQPQLAAFATQIQALGAMRDRIAGTWTWPVPNSITAVQALLVSGAPALLSASKSYIGPLLGL